MKKKILSRFILFAVLATFVTFTSCKDYDDDIKTLETGLSSLQSIVDDMQQKIEKSGSTITGVETTADGVIIKLSDGKKYTLTNGKDGVDGKDGSVVTIGENGNWFIDGEDTGMASKGEDGKDGADGEDGADGKDGADGADGKDGVGGSEGSGGIYYMPNEDGYWHKVEGETSTPTTTKWMSDGTITAKWVDGYVVLYNVEGSDEPITIGLVGLNKLVLIPDYVAESSGSPVLNFSSLVTPCGEIAPATLVKYQVSPINASESLIDKDNISFKYNNPQVLTRAADLNPKAEFVSLENGVLTVKALIDAKALEDLEENGDIITQLMLIVPTTSGSDAISDWGKVVTTSIGKISLTRVPTEENEDINWADFKLVETLADAKALEATNATVVELESDETLDLLEVVKTMLSEKSPWSDFNINRYNLEYTFDLNDENGDKIVYKLGDNDTDQQKFIDLVGSEISAKDIDGSNSESFTPIVRVMLKSKDDAYECNVLEGFIKVKINIIEEESPALEGLVGQWLFDDSDNLLKATVGNDLVLVGSHKVAEGPAPDNGAITIGKGSHYIVDHGIEPSEGQAKVNQYTIVYDFMVESLDNWVTFYQTDLGNTKDAHLFIYRSQGTIGKKAIGYSAKSVTPSQWHRLVASVNNGTEYSVYLDGEKILTGKIPDVDSDYSLSPNFIFFGDNDGDDGDINIASVSLYDRTLTAQEAHELGKFEAPPIEIAAPVGEWLFNNPDNLLKATIGNDLVLVGNHESIDGPMPDNRAIRIGKGSHYVVDHGIEPREGQVKVNEYSILFDYRVFDYDTWTAFYQCDRIRDARVFIRSPQGTIGILATGYSTIKAAPSEWQRLIVSVNNGSEYSLYLDGQKILTGDVQEVDGPFGLHPSMFLFADDNGEDGDIDIARVSLYDKALTPIEAFELGKIEVPYNPFLTTPYLQNATKTGMTIMWESDTQTPGKVHYGDDDTYGNEVAASVIATNSNTFINKAIIKGLEASTEYKYFVKQSDVESSKLSFSTNPDNDDANFTATVWADSHYANPWSKMVDYMMTEVQPDFALNAGDITNTGNRRSDVQTVFLPHVCQGIGSHIPFYSALGNHDVSGWGGGDLIRQYHDQPKEVNSDPNGFRGSYLMMYSNVAFIFIDWNRMGTDLVENGWFEQTLQSDAVKNARYRFVFIHCAPYYERWQSAEESAVKDNLPRIAEANNVNAVFSGHMHGHERGVKGGTQYFTIGGGSYLDHGETVGPVIYDHIIRGTDKPNNPVGFSNGLKNHFAEIKIENGTAEIKIHYFSSNGTHEGVIETIPLD